MKRYRIQICLVSGQSIPNITPVLDKAICPEKVILCATDAMKSNADILRNFLATRQIKSEIYELGNAYEFKELKEKFLDLASNFENTNTIGVNLTGGTKLMTIAAQEVFSGEFDLFYVIPEKERIIMVSDNNTPTYQLQNNIKLEGFFAVHGYTVKNIARKKNICQDARCLFDKLISEQQDYSQPLAALNYLASLAEQKELLKIKHEIPAKNYSLLNIFREHGAIKYYDDINVEFKDEESRRFCNGIWLEDYIYLQLKQLENEVELQDFAASVEIENQHGVKNEIDLAFLHRNTLYLVECKTAGMDEKGTDTVYKMDTVKGYAGLFTKGLLVSYNKLSPYVLQRAEDLNIKVICEDIRPDAIKRIIRKLLKVSDAVPDKTVNQ